MSDAPTEEGCRICGRSLLPGEQSIPFVTSEGEQVEVCELCKTRAEASGWMRPEELAAMRESGHVPERRRQRGQLFGSLRARGAELRERSARGTRRRGSGEEVEAAAEVAGEEQADPATEQGGHSSGVARPGPAGPTLEQALAAFNASEQRRTVAGLNRSLGRPRASGLAIRTDGGANGARITVAWELSWYQWEVGPGKRGIAIRQARQGQSVDELRAADRTWNLEVAQDGSLTRKRSRPPEGEADAADDAPGAGADR